MNSTGQSVKRPFENIDLAKLLLDNLREKNRSIEKLIRLPVKLQPSFRPHGGFFYPNVELTTLEAQTRFLESFERSGIATRSPYVSIMLCPSCSSHRFCSTFSCKLCRSSNIVRGSAIVHEPCGNIDFLDKYLGDDGTLICQKCNKTLKAIGVDYSRLDRIYNCLNCKAMLSDIDQFYKCLDCAKSLTLEESQILLLNEYVFDVDKLSGMVLLDETMLSVIKELDTMRIKAVHQGAVKGASGMSHTYSLVIYTENLNQPFLVGDVIETDHRTDERQILSFIGKCVDSRIENKIIVAFPSLEEDLQKLVNANGIKLVESRSREDIPFELVKSVKEMYYKGGQRDK